ncbi:MAG: TetR/AcrR family transcriptional regulator [Pseudomonadota bacterium]
MDNETLSKEGAPVKGTRARQKAATRARILQCALDAFAEKGFDGTSVRDIAAAAGVNHGLIRHHFIDKDNLWKAAVDFLFARLEKEMEPAPGDIESTGLEGLKNWIRRYVRYCARHPEHARIMVQESISDSDRLKWAVEKHIRPSHEQRLPTTQHLIRKGIYPDIDPVTMIYILVAAAQTVFVLGHEVREVHGIDVTSEEFINKHADGIITLFFDHNA